MCLMQPSIRRLQMGIALHCLSQVTAGDHHITDRILVEKGEYSSINAQISIVHVLKRHHQVVTEF